MKKVLITGAAGELGQGLIAELVQRNSVEIYCIDLQDKQSSGLSQQVIWKQGSVSDQEFVAQVLEANEFDTVFHFAALLSSSAAKNPALAQQVNVEASKFIIERSKSLAEQRKKFCRIVFPSSIAVYGLDSVTRNQRVKESYKSEPLTVYGKQKFEVEEFGSLVGKNSEYFDFRAIRFPGLISSETMPVGGTSDYGPLMAHFAARGEEYHCFVAAPTTLSFLAMPDAIAALLLLAGADNSTLSQNVYNLHEFSISAEEISKLVEQSFPDAKIKFVALPDKQTIVDSWPAELDDSAFRRDLKWSAKYGKTQTFCEYLFPKIKKRYESKKG